MKMEKSVLDRLIIIAKEIEESRPGVKLFICVWREELSKWDIVISAEWVDYNNLKDSVEIIFDIFKGKFNGEFALRFSGIYPLKVDEPFVDSITKLFPVTSTEEIKEFDELVLRDKKFSNMVIIISKPEQPSEVMDLH